VVVGGLCGVGAFGRQRGARGDKPRYYRRMDDALPRTRFQGARWLIAGLAILAAGCAQIRTTPAPREGAPSPEAAPRLHYEPALGESPAKIAQLRAAPAPAQPEIGTGATPPGDERVLNAKGFVRVGSGFIPRGEADVHDWSARQGQRVGADKALVYADAASGETRIDFYVRYRLPFGATFRSLTDAEREAVGSGGVQLGDIVGGTPASEANLRRGDFVLKFDGEPVADRPAFEHLLRDHLGKRVTLTVRRNDVTFDRLVRLGVVAKPAADGRK